MREGNICTKVRTQTHKKCLVKKPNSKRVCLLRGKDIYYQNWLYFFARHVRWFNVGRWSYHACVFSL